VKLKTVKARIHEKNVKVGATTNALAVEVGGFQAVSGAKREFLLSNGFYAFDSASQSRAEDFSKNVLRYLSQYVSIED
jgi:hypothetical protein